MQEVMSLFFLLFVILFALSAVEESYQFAIHFPQNLPHPLPFHNVTLLTSTGAGVMDSCFAFFFFFVTVFESQLNIVGIGKWSGRLGTLTRLVFFPQLLDMILTPHLAYGTKDEEKKQHEAKTNKRMSLLCTVKIPTSKKI